MGYSLFARDFLLDIHETLGSPDLKDFDERTPLSQAAGAGREAVVRILINRDDVDANSRDTFGRTPLLWAAEKGHEGVIAMLLVRNDVDINATDNKGRTPISWAAEGGPRHCDSNAT